MTDEKSLLLSLYTLLEQEHTVSIPQAAKLLGRPEEEVWDALETLVFCYDTSSIRLDLGAAHATLEKDRGHIALRLTHAETDVLIAALENQGFDASAPLTSKLLETRGFFSTEADSPVSRVNLASPGADGDVAKTLASACEDEGHHLVRIEYQKDGAPSATPRIVEPARIDSSDSGLFLQAWCHTARDWRTFRIDRIKGAEVLDETFTPRTGVPQPLSRQAPEAQVAHISFTAGTSMPPWPQLKAGTREDDGSIVGSIPWLGGKWLPKHIVALGGDAIALDPPALVDETLSYAKSLLG